MMPTLFSLLNTDFLSTNEQTKDFPSHDLNFLMFISWPFLENINIMKKKDFVSPGPEENLEYSGCIINNFREGINETIA